MSCEPSPRRDYLRLLLEAYYPLHFFALFRAHELFSVEPFVGLLAPPILDLGCGDGLIANTLFGHPLDYGIDPSAHAVEVARQHRAYETVFCGDAHHVPLPDRSLGGVFSNCALEHIPDIPGLIHEVSRLLRPGVYRGHMPLALILCHEPHIRRDGQARAQVAARAHDRGGECAAESCQRPGCRGLSPDIRSERHGSRDAQVLPSWPPGTVLGKVGHCKQVRRALPGGIDAFRSAACVATPAIREAHPEDNHDGAMVS